MSGKNLSKKIAAAAAGVAIGAASCMSVLAGDIHYIGIDSDPCRICGDGSVWVSEEYMGSYPSGSDRDCEHFRFGSDLEMVRHYIIHYECVDCGFVDSDDYNTFYWQCCGFDKPYATLR